MVHAAGAIAGAGADGRPLKLYQYVVRQLGRRIVSGGLQPGDSLPNEDGLSRQMGVSRGVIREAVKVLIQKGLVSCRPRVGTVVLPRDSWNLLDPDVLAWQCDSGRMADVVRDVMEVRAVIEAEAAALAARRAGDGHREAIRGLLARMEQGVAAGGLPEDSFVELDTAFHAAVLEAAGNELLVQITRILGHALLAARRLDSQDAAAQRQALPHHRRIAEAVCRGDADFARRAAADHVAAIWDQMRRHIGTQEPTPSPAADTAPGPPTGG